MRNYLTDRKIDKSDEDKSGRCLSHQVRFSFAVAVVVSVARANISVDSPNLPRKADRKMNTCSSSATDNLDRNARKPSVS